MTSNFDPTQPATQPPSAQTEAHPGRRVLHHLMALAGWVLFVYWWWVVFRRVSSEEIRFTFVFIAIALAVILGLTFFWVLHNRALFRKRNVRKKPIDSPGFVKRDSLGRRVRFSESRQTVRESSLVRIDVEDVEKVYYHGLLEIL